MTEPETTLALHAPLWGAAVIDGGIKPLSQRYGILFDMPDAMEWRSIEKTEVWTERQLNQVPPPPFLVAVRERPADESAYDGMRRVGAEMRAAVRHAVSALRLAASGWFIDPAMSSLTFAVWEKGDFLRLPGPYREAMLGGVVEVLPGYMVGTAAEEREQVSDLIDLVSDSAALGNTAVQIALAGFNRSYGYALPARDRGAELFTAVDAMLVGMSARRAGGVRLKRFGFRRRVEQALLVAGLDADASAREAWWLDGAEGGRGLRNALAHGRAGRSPETAELLRLQHLVRLLLRTFLTFAVQQPTELPDLPEHLGVRPDQGLVPLFNSWLETP